MPHFFNMAYRIYEIKDSYGNSIYPIVFDLPQTQVPDTYSFPMDTNIYKYISKNIISIGGELYNTNTYGLPQQYGSEYTVIRQDNSTDVRIYVATSKDVTKHYFVSSAGTSKTNSEAVWGNPFLCRTLNGKYYGLTPQPWTFSYHNPQDTSSLAYVSVAYEQIPKYPNRTDIGTVIPTYGKLSYNTWRFQIRSDITEYGEWLEKNILPIDDNDPNPGGGNSKPGGGGGDGVIGGDTNPDDGLPTISALDSGLLTAYNPTVGELQSLGRFLWSDSFDVSTFKKLFNDPFDTLLGLSVVPVKPNTSGIKNIMFGNMDSGVSSAVVSNQWVQKDMGSVTLKEVWKGALDYAPSTGVTIYLPFIGMRQLNVNDVMGSTLHLVYKFDVLTGACIAQIYVNHSSQGNKDGGFSWNENQGLVYEFIGQCAENIPLASQDFTNTIRAAIGGVSVAAGAAASVATGNPALGLAALTVGMANSGMQAATPTVERGGHLSGSAAIMGYSQPFLIVERPHQCKPSRYYALRGVPSQVYTSKLSNCTGFTQITANNNIHCSGAQDSELQEIQNLLVSGVYFPDSKR